MKKHKNPEPAREPFGGEAADPFRMRALPDSASRLQKDFSDREAGTVTVHACRFIPALLVSVLMLTVSGCQLLETREPEPQAPPAPAPVPEESTAEPVPQGDLSTVMADLESGRGDAARALLEKLIEDAPSSGVLASLMRQIDEPVEVLLPGPYREVEVGAGESLSLIASRELGDPLMFYALARLNGIAVPAQVPVGAVLKVPRAAQTGARSGTPPAGVAKPASSVTVPEVESVAEYLARSGQRDQARAMLIARLGEGDGADSTRTLLVRLTLEEVGEMRADGAYAPAVEAIDAALEAVGASGPREVLTEARQQIRSAMLREDALRLRQSGELVAAYEAAEMAANFESAPDEAAALMDDLRTELVGSLHNQALIAWRDRNVDLAIRTWESLLSVVPDFEPASVYLERARRLRERLDEP